MAVEPKPIDYRKLADALEYYTKQGYSYKEVPWAVSPEATQATIPAHKTSIHCRFGDLVGSAEQGFIELLKRGEMLQKHCAITPCFREEEAYDELHHGYFMKVELINANASLEALDHMIHDALEFLSRYAEVEVEQTGENMYDIITKEGRIELGSYGIRDTAFGRFVYGTGLALPRLDFASGLC